MRILNLYAGIGGNRKLWGEDHDITAIEYDQHTADIYKELYPNDTVIVADAHKYLLENYESFEFIWGSPPCPTHSRLNTTKVGRGGRPSYPDMNLYQEIIFLKKWYKGLFVIENVVPYYEPLIRAKKVDRHLWWSNFPITDFTPSKKPVHETAGIKDLEDFFNIDLSKYKPKGVNSKLKMLRNMVHPETGLHILNCAIGKYNTIDPKQINLFDNHELSQTN
jgi:DNA (cytosine-5)-methyltransferase 1